MTIKGYGLQSPIVNKDAQLKQGLQVLGVAVGVGVVVGVVGAVVGQLVWAKGADRVAARRLKRAQKAGFADYEAMQEAKAAA